MHSVKQTEKQELLCTLKKATIIVYFYFDTVSDLNTFYIEKVRPKTNEVSTSHHSASLSQKASLFHIPPHTFVGPHLWNMSWTDLCVNCQQSKIYTFCNPWKRSKRLAATNIYFCLWPELVEMRSQINIAVNPRLCFFCFSWNILILHNTQQSLPAQTGHTNWHHHHQAADECICGYLGRL